MIDLITKKIKHFLSLKIVTLVILFIIISARIIQLIFLFNVRSDRLYQMMATQSLVTGHGISIAQVIPANLSEIIYEPLIKWPPSYSLFYGLFYSLFNQNYIISGICLDILFSLFLIFISRSILKNLSIRTYIINIYTLFTGVIIYSFYIKPSSDAIAITLFLFAIHLSLLLFKTDKHPGLKLSGIIISLLFCATTKYLYMPVVFIIPIFFIIKGLADKDLQVKRAGYISLLVITGILGALLLYQKAISGSAVYITEPTRGFYPENLYSQYPVIPASFINPETIDLIFYKIEKTAPSIYYIYQWVNLIIAFFIVIYGIITIYKKGFRQLTLASIFFFLTFFISVAILILLLLLSITVAKEKDVWTYVEEARYYGLITVLLQLSIFIFLKYQYKNLGKYLIYGFCFTLLLMLPDMFRGIIFSANRILKYKKEEASWQVELKFQQYAEDIILREKNINGTKNAVIAGSSLYINKRISLYSHIPMMTEVLKINDLSSLNTKTSVLLLIVLRDDALQAFQPFLLLKEKKEQGQFNGFHFYTTYVTPH